MSLPRDGQLHTLIYCIHTFKKAGKDSNSICNRSPGNTLSFMKNLIDTLEPWQGRPADCSHISCTEASKQRLHLLNTHLQ